MIDGQLVMLAGFSTILTLVEISEIHVGATESHTFLEGMIVLGHSKSWYLKRGARAMNDPIIVVFDDLDLVHALKFDCLPPANHRQR